MNKRKSFVIQRWILRVLVLALLLAISLVGCTSTPEPTPTQPPTAIPTPEPSVPGAPVTDPEGPEITVEPGKTISIRASATGADKYEWKLQGKGEISSSTEPAILYTAPEEEGAIAILTVIAHNKQGASPPTSLTINIPAAPVIASISLEALEGIPAGWMSGGDSPENFIILEGGNASDCYTGLDCLKITYRTGGNWAGIFWWPLDCGGSGTPDAWDRVRNGTCGINVLDVGNLSEVNRLTFWARGGQGGEVVEFKIGAADVLPSPGRSLGNVTLESTWKQYEIDLEGMDLTNAIGLFLWTATDVHNPQGAVFYLDDIQFEGVR
jgi:hypothetical protein